MQGFEKIINHIPKIPGIKILDVGCGGLSGENTTTYLVERFGQKAITGVCIKHKEVERFREVYPDINLIHADFYNYPMDEKFDVVVLDLNIENNLKDWGEERLKWIQKYLKDGGILINYVMTTDAYGDPYETPELIRTHWKSWWGVEKLTHEAIGNKLMNLSDWEVFDFGQEERRDYIFWVALKWKK